jgi:hypothetical protein
VVANRTPMNVDIRDYCSPGVRVKLSARILGCEAAGEWTQHELLPLKAQRARNCVWNTFTVQLVQFCLLVSSEVTGL